MSNKLVHGTIKSYLPAKDPEEPDETKLSEPLPELDESSSSQSTRPNPNTFRVKFVMTSDQDDIKLNIKQKIKARIIRKKQQKRKQIIDQEASSPDIGYSHGIPEEMQK